MPVFFIIASMTAARQSPASSIHARSPLRRTTSIAASSPITGSEKSLRKLSGKNTIMHRKRSGTPRRCAPLPFSGARPSISPNVSRP